MFSVFLKPNSVNYRPAPTCRARKPGMRGLGMMSFYEMKVLSGEQHQSGGASCGELTKSSEIRPICG